MMSLGWLEEPDKIIRSSKKKKNPKKTRVQRDRLDLGIRLREIGTMALNEIYPVCIQRKAGLPWEPQALVVETLQN